MSAIIWQEWFDAVQEIKPELAEEANLCRNREAIVEFLEKHFPLDDDQEEWEFQLMSRVPNMLRERQEREQSKPK